jgi:hypothetical protein
MSTYIIILIIKSFFNMIYNNRSSAIGKLLSMDLKSGHLPVVFHIRPSNDETSIMAIFGQNNQDNFFVITIDNTMHKSID